MVIIGLLLSDMCDEISLPRILFLETCTHLESKNLRAFDLIIEQKYVKWNIENLFYCY